MTQGSRLTVTQPSLPPLDDYVELLRDIWDRRWLTNKGHYHDAFEKALAEYLDVPYVSLFCNGTVALQVGLQALRITGEVITTPFSFPATTHAIYWNHCSPVFCDIDPDTWNLDSEKVEALISPKTTAILPTHVYGTPCDVEGLKRIADTYGLRLLYDAAHAFAVKVAGRSVLRFGDLSMLSFHATKVFQTAEGGALVTASADIKQRIDHLKNFGFVDEVTVVGPGTNGKMNELQAALGLVQLRFVDGEIAKRQQLAVVYRDHLRDVPGIRLLAGVRGATSNHGYLPIAVDEPRYGQSRDTLYEGLKARGVFCRRYFFPLISDIPAYRGCRNAGRENLPVAARAANSVICLPIYPALQVEDAHAVCDIIRSAGRGASAQPTTAD